jgi:hypothetical protein
MVHRPEDFITGKFSKLHFEQRRSERSSPGIEGRLPGHELK